MMDRQDHFNHVTRSLGLVMTGMAAQMNYPVFFDFDKFREWFTADLDGSGPKASNPWEYAPAANIPLNTSITPSNPRAMRCISSEVFQRRSDLHRKFVDQHHIPYASCIPDIAVKGAVLDLPKEKAEAKSKGKYYTDS